MGIRAFDEQHPLVTILHITSGVTTAPIGMNVNVEYYWRLDHVWVSTDSVTSRVVEIGWIFGGVFAPIGSFLVPAGAGLGGTPGIDLMAQILGTPNDGIAFYGAPQEGDGGFAFRLGTGLASGETMVIMGQGGTLA